METAVPTMIVGVEAKNSLAAVPTTLLRSAVPTIIVETAVPAIIVGTIITGTKKIFWQLFKQLLLEQLFQLGLLEH